MIAAASVASMTGFARAEGAADGAAWAWEARSVNSKGLDLKLRVPPGWEAIEPLARSQVGAWFRRGSVQLALSVQRADAALGGVVLDSDLLEKLIALSAEPVAAGRVAPPRWDGLLQVRGVLRATDANESTGPLPTAWQTGVLETLDRALAALQEARLREGAVLGGVLGALLEQMETAASGARRAANDAGLAQSARLRERLAAMQIELDPQRLAMEVALLAAKADITEELDRLDAHLVEANALLASGEPVGRRLEFLTQELQRESNTLCAKSNALTLTRLGLDLKTMIDQFREQAANVE